MPVEKSIVFRRWSRKGYAIFAGLGKHIVIGVLAIGICMMAMLKTGVVTSDDSQQAGKREMARDREEENDVAGKAIGEGLVCLVGKAERGGCACENRCDRDNINRRGMRI